MKVGVKAWICWQCVCRLTLTHSHCAGLCLHHKRRWRMILSWEPHFWNRWCCVASLWNDTVLVADCCWLWLWLLFVCLCVWSHQRLFFLGFIWISLWVCAELYSEDKNKNRDITCSMFYFLYTWKKVTAVFSGVWSLKFSAFIFVCLLFFWFFPFIFHTYNNISTYGHFLFQAAEGKSRVLYFGITCGLSAPFVAGQLDYCLQHLDRFTPVLVGFNPGDLAR